MDKKDKIMIKLMGNTNIMIERNRIGNILIDGEKTILLSLNIRKD